MRLRWSLEKPWMVHQLTQRLVAAAVEVAVDVEIIKTNTVIVGMIMTSAMVMVAAMIVRIMVVAVADMEVVVVMAAKTPREIARTMAMEAAPMRLLRYVARLGILCQIVGRD
jgi:hypothetical protein